MHLAVETAVGVEHPHAVVVAGDVFLQDQLILVAAAVDGVCDLVKFLPVLGQKDLLLVREAAVPVGCGIAGLDNDRELKRQADILVVFRRAGCGFGIGQTMGLAGTVEIVLDVKVQHRLKFRAGKMVVGCQCLAMAGQQDGVAVSAGNQHQRFGLLLGKVHQSLDENVVLLQTGFQHRNVHQLAVGRGHQRPLAHGNAGDAILLIKAARHAVYIGIAAQKHRKKIRHVYDPLYILNPGDIVYSILLPNRGGVNSWQQRFCAGYTKIFCAFLSKRQ